MKLIKIQAPAPKEKGHVRRLTDEMKKMGVNEDEGVVLDVESSRCLVQYGRWKGWSMVQQKQGDRVIVWRVG